MKTLSRSAAVWIAIGCVVLGAPSAGGADPPAPATAPTPGGDAWDGDSVDLSTGIFVHRKTDLYVDGAIPIALTRTYRSGDSGARPFGIGSSHPYQIFLSATAPYQEASLILADGSAIRYVRTSPGTDVLGAVFEHLGTPTAFYGSTLTGAAAAATIEARDTQPNAARVTPNASRTLPGPVSKPRTSPAGGRSVTLAMPPILTTTRWLEPPKSAA
jgi:hypothetical protein